MNNSRIHVVFDAKNALANVLVVLAILWIATTWLPEYYWVSSPSQLVIAALLYGFSSLGLTIIVFMLGAFVIIKWLRREIASVAILAIVAITIIILSNAVALLLVSRWLPGFSVAGFWPAVGLSIVKGIATPVEKKGTREG